MIRRNQGQSKAYRRLLATAAYLHWGWYLGAAVGIGVYASRFINDASLSRLLGSAGDFDAMNRVYVQYIAVLIAATSVLALLVMAYSTFRYRRVRGRLLSGCATLYSLRRLSWSEFELMVGQAYRKQGYRVLEAGQGGADGGVDLILNKGSYKIIVQCKHWKDNTVGVKVVREVYGIMFHAKANAVKIVISGSFSKDAWAFVKGKPIDLVDGRRLMDLIGGYKAG